jgi:hypothetical protein
MNGTLAAPVVDGRRRAALLAMLEQLVPTCLPDWRAGGGQSDVAQAILSIAARLEAEVTQRLDRVPDKQFRNFLDWIGIHRDPARAARLYVVLLTAPGAPTTVLAPPRLRLQAQVSSGPIVFETDQDMLVVPGTLTDLIAVDGTGDKLYLPFPGLLTAAAPDSLPRVRALAGPAGAGAKTVQVTPALGLAPGQFIGIGGAEYRITEVKNDLVSIDPPLDVAANANDPVAPVTSLVPFPPGAKGDTAARNWQSHELYIGDADLLNIESDATIVVNGGDLLKDATWTYWGLAAGSSTPDWLAFKPTFAAGTLTLAKQQTSTLPQTTFFGQNSRWLRAKAASPQAPTTLPSGLTLLVSAPTSAQARPVRVDALANTVPLVTTTEFFPLGREPRLFDQFYVSAPEAMSKKGAVVTLNFDAADESLGPLVPAEGVAFSVRRDGMLVVITPATTGLIRTVIPSPVTAPPVTAPPSPAQQSRPVLLDTNRLPSVAVWGILPYVAAVSQEKQVWLWGEVPPFVGPPSWVALDAPDGTLGAVAVALTTGPGATGTRIVVLAAVENTLRTRILDPSAVTAPAAGWQTGVSLPLGTNIAQIAVLRRPAAPEKVVLVGESGSLWLLDDPAGMAAPQQFTNVGAAKKEITPAGLWIDPDPPWIVTADANNEPFAITADPTAHPVPISGGRKVADDGGFGLLWDTVLRRPIVLFRPQDLPRTMVVWPVGGSPLPDETITQDTDLRGPPVAVSPPFGGRTTLLVSAINRAVYSRDWTDLLVLPEADLGDGVRATLTPQVPDATEGTGLLESRPRDPTKQTVYAIDQQIALNGDHVFRPTTSFAAGVGPAWRLLMPKRAILSGTVNGTTLSLDPTDAANDNDLILIGTGLDTQNYGDALSFSLTGVAGGSATLNPAPPASWLPNTHVRYVHVRASGEATGTIRPTLANVPQAQRQTLLDRGLLAAATPGQQTVLGDPAGAFLVLAAAWTNPPQAVEGNITFGIPPVPPGPWTADQQPVVPNPELSWEYWNGSSWWLLGLQRDETRNLLQSGAVTFAVPVDLAPTDVAGRNQPWVRARLIGGDYGKEIYKLSGIPGRSQTAERDTSQIHPPRMLGLQVGYALTTAQPPDLLLTVDSRGLRDQSAANRLSGAKVTAFQPVADMLAGFGPDQAAAGSRALFLGITAAAAALLEGGVIRLLALVREQPGQVRLIAETLRDGHFVELALIDDTGGLGQDGLLSITLDAPLQLAGLFGQDRYWLRLRPRPDDPGLGSWQPVLQGLYLNAASAQAAETQGFEILGSSDGSPAQRVTLARRPVLAGSLDLRVLEPLADEDIATLRIGDPDRVKTDIPGRPGAWVRWTEVPDVVDAAPAERAYRLDPASGDIFFGDAQAGMVPPVGRDGIAALTYRRVGTAAANQVAAWASLNLVTTLPGVEQVVAPRPAAGGADPASDATTLADAPAALRDRGRAITGADLEAIALANTSELAQARFIQSGRATRLVVVATGRDPRPGKALRQALRARLASVTLPRLAARGGLVVDPPVLRPLALTAALTVESLDVGGTVDAAARTALEKLLDPATGGVDGRGWPLGTMPGEADVMAVLVEVDGLVGVTSLVFSDVDTTGALHTPPRVFAADELAVLAPDRLVLSLTPVTP